MRQVHIIGLLLAIVAISASRLQTTPLIKQAEQPAPNTGWFSSIWTRIYDWWYGKPSDCRDIVIWQPDESSAEEWTPDGFDESSGSGAITSWSTSSGSDKEKKTGKRPNSDDDQSKSVYETFFAKREGDENPVWKGSLDSTPEPDTKQSLEAPNNMLEGENLDSDDVFKRSNPAEKSLK